MPNIRAVSVLIFSSPSRMMGSFAATVLLMTAAPLPAADSIKQTFDIPAGEAIDTLKSVAHQSGLQIMYSAAAVRGVRTHAVRGEYDIHDALNRMVANTVLKIVRDDKTGALTVVRIPPGTDSPRPPPPPRKQQITRIKPRDYIRVDP